MNAISVFRFKVSAPTGEMLASAKWATAAAIAALDGERLDGVEWKILEKWIDDRGLTVEGVHERSTHFQTTVAERPRTMEEAAQRWLDGPGQ